MRNATKTLSWCVLAALALPAAGFDAALAETPRAHTRCGWFSNPSPNNASLTDRDGEWAIAVQGQFEAKGEWPEFKKSQWVSSGNASYGYGCACMRVVTDQASQRITAVMKATAKPLLTCRRDKALKAPARD